ncbi:hypothetical protein DFR70_101145 [Nocardia tenerifensis]|uniref:Uncharacterized protein n=1 Tax=Nocardia tenerifensis TaxID=228006 RepID=A0A318KXS6_9NOCA|nr:hypothetical protein [Nocardia tenerifensis]PXX70724.1 hypothetical protein DFR70_101145 [Nocardia tenerifensis]
MNRHYSYEVTVAAPALDDLILAVHEVACQSGGRSPRRWRYGNVVGISAPRVRDLALATVQTKHAVAGRVVAAITVTLHRRVAVDVIFTLDDVAASAQFHCATKNSEIAKAQETSWAAHLVTETSAALNANDITTSVSCGCTSATD